MRLYAGAAFRVASLPLHPLDFRATLDQIEETLKDHAEKIGDRIGLQSAFAALFAARGALEDLYRRAADAASVQAARPFNDALLRIGRELVGVQYAGSGRYRQDPALDLPLLPDFAGAVEAIGTAPDGVIRIELVRARNRLEGALLAAAEVASSIGQRG
jgi:hypothetical protein